MLNYSYLPDEQNLGTTLSNYKLGAEYVAPSHERRDEDVRDPRILL